MTITLESLEFDYIDRMRKSLRLAGVSGSQMADFLGVDAGTVSTWLNGKHKPSRMALRLWAQRTEVPLEWLESGDLESRLRESNSRPSHYKVLTHADMALAA